MNGFEFGYFAVDEEAMLSLGACLAAVVDHGLITLEGELGAGKTTLVRGLLRALGWQDKVKSPSFTLIEAYDLDGYKVYHMDLYRLTDPQELEWLGVRDIFGQEQLCLLEWPQNAHGQLPAAIIAISICYQDGGRQVQFRFHSSKQGQDFVASLQ